MDEDDQLDRQTAWLRAQEALEDCDSMLAMLRERDAQGPASTWKPPEPERRPSADVVEQQRTQPMHSNGNDYWNKHQAFIEAVIDQRLGATTRAWIIKHVEDFAVSLGGGIGEEIAVVRKQDRELLRGELKTALDTLRAELRHEFQLAIASVRIAGLEAQLAERASPAPRSTVPRLIAGGSTDAAD